MKISGCETIAVRVDFEGMMTGTHIVLRLRTDQGLEGISYVSRLGPGTVRPMCLLIDAMVAAGPARTATVLAIRP